MAHVAAQPSKTPTIWEKLSDEGLRDLAERFVMTPAGDRVKCRFTACPPHVRKNWLLGVARREREEARKLSASTVIQAMPVINFVFEEDATHAWTTRASSEMTQEELDLAKQAWKEAEENEATIDAAAMEQDGGAPPDTSQSVTGRP